MQDLAAKLEAFCDEQPFGVAWYLKDLRSGERAGQHEDDIVSAASVRKIAILAAALAAVHSGRISLADKLRIRKPHRKNRSGCVRHLDLDTLTLKDALSLMTVVSDNACTAAVVDAVGLDEINSYAESLDLANTVNKAPFPPYGREHLKRYKDTTTAKETGHLLEHLLKGARSARDAKRISLSPKLCRLALEMLKRQMLNDRLPLLLPMGTRVAHKTGTRSVEGAHNDAGIVYYAGRPRFILCVFVRKGRRRPSKAEACLHIAQMARMCYDGIIGGRMRKLLPLK